MSYIKGLNCCFPSNKVCQDQIVELSKEIFSKSKREFEKMLMVYKNSGVNTRYLVQSLDWYRKEHNWKERSILFKESKNLKKLIKSKNICGQHKCNTTRRNYIKCFCYINLSLILSFSFIFFHSITKQKIK